MNGDDTRGGRRIGVSQRPRKLLPPHYFMASLLLIAACAVLPGPGLLPLRWSWVGVAPVVLGLWVALRGARQFERAGTGIRPLSPATVLVTDGVFAWSRNPMYAGMVAVLTGTAVLVDNAVALVVVAAFATIVRILFVGPEERFMRVAFGAEYDAYCDRVRRWF